MNLKNTLLGLIVVAQGALFTNTAVACTSTSVTPDATTLPVVTGPCSISILAAPTATTSCGDVIYGTTTTTFPIVNQGTTVVTWTFDDGQGNVVTQEQNVIINDAVAPTVTAPADVITSTDPGSCTATNVVLGTPVVIDNCSAISMSNDAPATFSTGITTVTWTVTDVGGNTVTATQSVKVTDMEAPVVTCPANMIVNADPGLCYASSVAVAVPATAENCTLSTLVHDAPAQFPVGSTIVNWTATDAAGNTGTCAQVIEVIETVPPTASTPDSIHVECPNDVPAPDVSVVTNVADNCGTPVVAWIEDVSNEASCNEIITRYYSVSDGNGNEIVVEQIIAVKDITPPDAADPAPISAQCIGDLPAPNPQWVSNVYDNCTANPTVTWIEDIQYGQAVPLTFIRKYKVEDDCGNATYVHQQMTVLDVTAPVPDVSTLPMVSVSCSDQVQAPTATDNCYGSIAGVSDVQFPITTPGITTVTWTYTDNHGNSITQSQDIEITGVDASVSTGGSTGMSLVADNANATSYQWVDCISNTPVPGATSQYFTPAYNGQFAVVVTVGDCSEMSECIIINSLGLDEEGLTDMMLYPNPSDNGEFTVRTSGNIQTIEVFDMTGRNVEVDTDLTTGKVNASGLSNGKYMVRIVLDTQKVLQNTIVINQ